MSPSREYFTNPSVANPDIHLQGVQYEKDPDAAYGEHIRNTFAICNSSASHTYGNALSIVEKYLLDLFPADLFKTVTASTTLGSKQVTHTPQQLHKKELPMMVLVPRISFGQDDNRFLANTLINSRVNSIHSFYGGGSLIQLAEDRRRGLYVHGHYNRVVMYVDVILSFNTYAEQVNWMSHLYNMASINHNQFIAAPLELYIPPSFCELIGNLAKVDVRDKNGSVYNFLSYMNSIWYHPITYKLKGGSNSDEFFMYYITDIDTLIPDPQPGSGVKDGQVYRLFDISFTMRCDFNSIGYFTLNSPSLTKRVVVNNGSAEDASIVPMFSDVINLDDFGLPIGWQVVSWPVFKLNHGEDRISIDTILNQSLKSVIGHHLKLGIPMDKFIQIQFRENGQILTDEMYYIDWNKLELVLLNPNYRRTYRLIISVSVEYINNLVKELYNLE